MTIKKETVTAKQGSALKGSKEPRTPLPLVFAQGCTMGCDPEFFFASPEVGVIGAENVFKKEGLSSMGGKFIIDGVQAELNPNPNSCRESLAHNIATCFKTLQLELAAQAKSGKKVSLDFSRSIEISDVELKKLAEANQRLGCAPSLNADGDKGKPKIKLEGIDGSKHRQRSAGGHIHFSGNQNQSTMIQWNHREIVHMLDLLVGNTCVLLDRDPSNKERRKLYGRAGEYRLPFYGPNKLVGLEYRTLSNFWLTSYPLMSLVFGLARTAFEMVTDTVNGRRFYEEFTKAVPAAKVRTAINTNNAKLAMENFRAIEALLYEAIPLRNGHFPISRDSKPEFDYFIEKIEQSGLEYWFKKDPLTHWCELTDINGNGFYNYTRSVITPDMQKSKSIIGKVASAIGL